MIPFVILTALARISAGAGSLPHAQSRCRRQCRRYQAAVLCLAALFALGGMLTTAAAQVPQEFLVDALGCEVAIDSRYHVQLAPNGITVEIPHTLGARMWIQPVVHRTERPLDSGYRGALKVSRYPPGCMSISPDPWTVIQGLHQEVVMEGFTDAEVGHLVEHCNATMNPDAIAIAARMAKGCAAVLPTEAATEALLGKAATTGMVEMGKGRRSPTVTAWAIFMVERSPNLVAQGVNKGTLLTSICGVPVSEVEEGGGSLCCATPLTDHIEGTIVEDGKSRTITATLPVQLRQSPNAVTPSSVGCGGS